MNNGEVRPFPHIVAHKGLSGVCPENTLASFGAAVGLVVDEIETDLWGCRDGKLVVCHDPDILRTTSVQGIITEMDWADIKERDAGSWFGTDWRGVCVPCLDEVLDRAHAHGIICNLFSNEESLGHENIVEESRERLQMGIDAILTNYANLLMTDKEFRNASN